MQVRPPIRRVLAAAALAVPLLAAGCASHDYRAARETRFDRPYRGGAAAVPDEVEKPASECVDADSPVLAIPLFGIRFVLPFFHAPDHVDDPAPAGFESRPPR
jgi:hypothetical protein